VVTELSLYVTGDQTEHTMTQHQAEPFGRLSPQDANQRVASGELKIVDVRENWEYARDHIPSATLTPLGQIIAKPQDVIKSDNVIFVCEVGQRSAVAAEMAAALGMQHVFNLEGGMQAWRTAGLPVES
jgi:sulfur-carrier protein adenylyltransferase/sulfurtransferase